MSHFPDCRNISQEGILSQSLRTRKGLGKWPDSTLGVLGKWRIRPCRVEAYLFSLKRPLMTEIRHQLPFLQGLLDGRVALLCISLICSSQPSSELCVTFRSHFKDEDLKLREVKWHIIQRSGSKPYRVGLHASICPPIHSSISKHFLTAYMELNFRKRRGSNKYKYVSVGTKAKKNKARIFVTQLHFPLIFNQHVFGYCSKAAMKIQMTEQTSIRTAYLKTDRSLPVSPSCLRPMVTQLTAQHPFKKTRDKWKKLGSWLERGTPIHLHSQSQEPSLIQNVEHFLM